MSKYIKLNVQKKRIYFNNVYRNNSLTPDNLSVTQNVGCLYH